MNATARAAHRMRYVAETLHEREFCRPVGAEREQLLAEAARLEQQAHTLGRAPERVSPAPRRRRPSSP